MRVQLFRNEGLDYKYFSRPQLIIITVALIAVGGYMVYRSAVLPIYSHQIPNPLNLFISPSLITPATDASQPIILTQLSQKNPQQQISFWVPLSILVATVVISVLRGKEYTLGNPSRHFRFLQPKSKPNKYIHS